MINFKKQLCLFMLFAFCGVNIVCSETYFCADTGGRRADGSYYGGFSGDFDISSQKPDKSSCEKHNGNAALYDNCKRLLKYDIEKYDKYMHAYQQGNCHKYQSLNHHYGSATCSLKYVALPNGYSIHGNNSSSNNSDKNICLQQLKNKIMQMQKN